MRNDMSFESDVRTKYPLAFREEDELRTLALALLARELEFRRPRRMTIRHTRLAIGGFFSINKITMTLD